MDHYAVVGMAILETLETALGDDWNPDLMDAWSCFYEALSEQM